MTSLPTSLVQKLSYIIGQAFIQAELPVDLGAVRVSDRPDLCQFQCNGAMAGARIAKKNPRAIAETILEILQNSPEALIFKTLEIAGPGFINIDLSDSYISDHLSAVIEDNRLGVPVLENAPSVVLDYGGPNIAKPMHVGHLRASIIGDCLRRLYVFAGYNALGDVHLGDWGLPMGQIISELNLRHPDWPYFDEAYSGAYPSESPVTLEDLETIYPAASQACKADEARKELARRATVELQNGRPGYRALWQHFIDVSIEGMKENFDRLGVHFDLWKGEADVHDLIAPMVEDLKQKGLAHESNGALVVSVERSDDKKEMPPLILYKSDGAVMYGTTDMATLVERMSEYNPVKIIYATDQRQSLHFEQVFRAAKAGQIVPDGTDLIHAGFGTMNGTDGKPFKTRTGGVMNLSDLIDTVVQKATARLDEAALAQDMSTAEREAVAYKIGIAALKFADLQNNRTSDYIFDIDRMMSFEGKTGPYLLYQSVRIGSLLEKAKSQGLVWDNAAFTLDDTNRSIYLLLSELPDHFENALKNHTPHILCDYLFRLAQEFSSFYGRHHILSEDNEAVREGRLALCALVQRYIGLILGLLGIEVPERM